MGRVWCGGVSARLVAPFRFGCVGVACAAAMIPCIVVLAVAGVFQFSRLKYLCLEKCRTPLGFVTSHWHGPRPQREAFLLGLAHGVFCVGCCWALMLLMFLVGMGNTAWMLILGLAMAVEKNHPWGRRLSAPLGCALTGMAMMLFVLSVA